jgi:cysteinyl-tRNA synthetase
MTLRLYNTATRKKEPFCPLQEGKVGIYVCGVTVYDLCHIGHARSAIVFDVLVRYLRAKGLDVTYVRNFTDVDDKIIKRAQETGKDTTALAQEYIDAFYEDMGRLGVLNADEEPRATEHIDGMIHMVATLLEKGYAYPAGGDVFFSVRDFKEYGRLSGRRLEDMQAGSRIAVDEKKRHPMDFVLWKGAKPGEPRWASPWGPGRPGWHLECSVMSHHYLGPSFDIHGGGRDLLFPHHENERAQSICANGGGFANCWVHNGFVTVDSEKMSKSLGNFLTIRDALALYHPEVLRFFLLSKHYRSPLDFSKSAVMDIQSGLVRIYRTLQRLEDLLGPQGEQKGPSTLKDLPRGSLTEGFVNAMDDDLNTAGALGLIFERIRELNKTMDTAKEPPEEGFRLQLRRDYCELLFVGKILGLFQEMPQAFFDQIKDAEADLDPSRIEEMVKERDLARGRKDWKTADEIRDRLKGAGVVLEDEPTGTTWRWDV